MIPNTYAKERNDSQLKRLAEASTIVRMLKNIESLLSREYVRSFIFTESVSHQPSGVAEQEGERRKMDQ